MSEEIAYAKHARSTVHRHKERALYDYATVHSIVNQCSILHVSFAPSSDDPFPTTLPMLGQMGAFAPSTGSGPLDIYLHGHAASRLMRLPKSDSTPSEGLPICVSAALLDGIVLALTPFNHSCNYRSVTIHGYASVVTDEQEKLWAMHLITDGLVPERWDNSRVPPTKAESTSTGVLKVVVESASAKVHVGGPSDDRKDLKDETVTSRVWTGVVPVRQHLLTPVAGEKNMVAGVPQYLRQWIDENNSAGEEYAYKVARSDTKK